MCLSFVTFPSLRLSSNACIMRLTCADQCRHRQQTLHWHAHGLKHAPKTGPTPSSPHRTWTSDDWRCVPKGCACKGCEARSALHCHHGSSRRHCLTLSSRTGANTPLSACTRRQSTHRKRLPARRCMAHTSMRQCGSERSRSVDE